MDQQLYRVIFGFVALAGVFGALESLWPSVPKPPGLRRGFATDVMYWFFTPLATRAISHMAVALAVISLLLVMGRPLDLHAVQAGMGPVVKLPLWLQVILGLLLGDFTGYWVHRWFHGVHLWKFHAVHHSSKDLDWLSSVRLHPVNDIVARVCQAVPLVLLGFSPLVVAAYLPFLTFYAILLHANVPWTFGPLRYVLASPVFHRWHHAKKDEPLEKNFAGLFPVIDIVFGTSYMPSGRRPTEFGLCDDAVPESFWGQLTYPLSSHERRALGPGPKPGRNPQ